MAQYKFDQLNKLNETAITYFRSAASSEKGLPGVQDEVEMIFEALLILAFVYGKEEVDKMLSVTTETIYLQVDVTENPEEFINQAVDTAVSAIPEIDADRLYELLGEEIADKTYLDRVQEYIDLNDSEALCKVLDTESHRIYADEAQFEAEAQGATTKTWFTQMDNKVRDTHSFLLGVTIGVDEKFNTYDGDSAKAPGLFELPENNINCRCFLYYAY